MGKSLLICLSLSLTQKHSNDVSASLLPSGHRPKCEIHSLVHSLKRSGYVKHFQLHTHTYIDEGAQVVCCSGLIHTHTNFVKHDAALQQQTAEADESRSISQTLKNKKQTASA